MLEILYPTFPNKSWKLCQDPRLQNFVICGEEVCVVFWLSWSSLFSLKLCVTLSCLPRDCDFVYPALPWGRTHQGPGWLWKKEYFAAKTINYWPTLQCQGSQALIDTSSTAALQHPEIARINEDVWWQGWAGLGQEVILSIQSVSDMAVHSNKCGRRGYDG